MATWLHGDASGCATLAGAVWLTRDRAYAEGYAAGRPGHFGRVIEVALRDGLEVLDLTAIDVDDDADGAEEALAHLLDRALVDVSRCGLGCGEMHQRIPTLRGAIEAAGYDAVEIRERTYDVGDAITLCVFDLGRAAEGAAVAAAVEC